MWLLLIVFAGPLIFSTQELYRYDTIQECQIERDRIGFIMADEYPDAGFQIVCQFQASVLKPRRA